jgi:predicted glycogen debranching enzyme
MHRTSRTIRSCAGAPVPEEVDRLLSREWLVANGLGGYASTSLVGACTRRYHGLLVAALPAPIGRTVMLSHLGETLLLADGRTVRLAAEESGDGLVHWPGADMDFELAAGLPVWKYRVGELVLQKSIVLPHGQNTVQVSYRLLRGAAARLLVRPSLHFRPHEVAVEPVGPSEYEHSVEGARQEMRSRARTQLPPLRLLVHGEDAIFEPDEPGVREFRYRIEQARGYAHRGEVWSPGHWRIDLARGQDCTLLASTEPWEVMLALDPGQVREAELERRGNLVGQAHPAVRDGIGAELVLAADAFIVSPSARQGDARRAQAQGDEARTIVAGYHWFTDWGRDTMISLEGLALVTGRHAEAGSILRTFQHYVRDGLIPNLFPEGENEGLYHTADATLWFFHAMDRYLAYTGDTATLRRALPVFRSIVAHHLRGTRFGIGVDPADGLLRQGAQGYQLTWMDAKVDGWVVTPRRGKAVELNALFYNALRLMQQWVAREGDAQAAREMQAHADRLAESFNRRFWNPATGSLFDVVDGEAGDDAAIRPNMLLSISLPHPVLERDRWSSVLEVAARELLTPVGLRTLAPGHPDYQPRYDGDLRARDAAYHQGTVWAWLAGPFADAWLQLHQSDSGALQLLREGLRRHLDEAGIGTISEIFDAQPPHAPRGCIAQAWSVAEALRLLVRLGAPGDGCAGGGNA